MHAYDFLQRYGTLALVMQADTPVGQAFAEQLAKGGFDLLLPVTPGTDLSALKARLEDHEGVNVSILAIPPDTPDFAEQLLSASQPKGIGLFVCCMMPGQVPGAGSMIASLTRVFMPTLEARARSGLVLIDYSGNAHSFAATLSRELLTVDTDMLRIDVSSIAIDGPASAKPVAVQSIASLGDVPLLEIAEVASLH